MALAREEAEGGPPSYRWRSCSTCLIPAALCCEPGAYDGFGLIGEGEPGLSPGNALAFYM